MAALAATAPAAAQPLPAGAIYTCIDAQGRRLTSDRPIPACIDREQKILNHSGTVRQVIGPTLTPLEQQQADERRRQRDELRQREAEERRRERALLARYPTRNEHDAERAKALDAVEEVIRAARQRIEELHAEREKLSADVEFYKDPAKVPAHLVRAQQDNEKHLAAQHRFLANQQEEQRRINARFDEELARLRTLWAQLAPAGQPGLLVR